jgi:hypothetical protein
MEVMMNTMAMYKTKMMRRLPTTLVLVVTSRVLSKDKTTTSLESLKKCPYKTGQNPIKFN